MKSLKKFKILAIFIIFALCFPLHFLYEWVPNPIFSIFLPVNESIWEHMKLIYTSYMLYSVIEYFWLKKKEIHFENYGLQTFLVPLMGIIIYLLIFVPLYQIFGENMFISLGVLFLIVGFEEALSYYMLLWKKIPYEKFIGIVGIIVVYILFTVLTYKPFKNELFYDIKEEKYGIDIYESK